MKWQQENYTFFFKQILLFNLINSNVYGWKEMYKKIEKKKRTPNFMLCRRKYKVA